MLKKIEMQSLQTPSSIVSTITSQVKSESKANCKMSVIARFNVACERGDIDVAKKLVVHEDLTSDDVRSGFGKACEGGHFELAKWILSASTTSLNSMGLDRPIITKTADEEWVVMLDGYKNTYSNVKEYSTYSVKRENGILSVKVKSGTYITNNFVGDVEDAKRRLSELEIPARPSEKYILWFVIVFYSMLN